MRRVYRDVFEFVDTEQEAIDFCSRKNAGYTTYMRRKHPSHYTPWSSADGTESKFVCWYMV